MKVEEAMKEAEARGVKLPSDMVEAAKDIGIRRAFLFRYLDLQGSAWPLGFLMKHCSLLRDRVLADPSFLFKVGTERFRKEERISGRSLSFTLQIFWPALLLILPWWACWHPMLG